MGFTAKYPNKIISLSYTALDDAKFRLASRRMWFEDVNIHCVTAACKYGDFNRQDATIHAGDGISFRNCDLAELYFINHTAGVNTTLYVVGVLMTPARQKELGVYE